MAQAGTFFEEKLPSSAANEALQQPLGRTLGFVGVCVLVINVAMLGRLVLEVGLALSHKSKTREGKPLVAAMLDSELAGGSE